MSVRKTMEIYGKNRAFVVTFSPRTYKKKIHWLSRTILRTKRKLHKILRRIPPDRKPFEKLQVKSWNGCQSILVLPCKLIYSTKQRELTFRAPVPQRRLR